jgi:Tfp pilus assembly protein PilX
MRTSGNDCGAVRLHVITAWLVVLAILGVCAFDVVSIAAARISTETDAQSAAYAASTAWHASRNIDSAYNAAQFSITGNGETVLAHQFTVDPDGTVHLVLRRQVHTLLLSHIGSLRHYTIVLEHGDADSIN